MYTGIYNICINNAYLYCIIKKLIVPNINSCKRLRTIRHIQLMYIMAVYVGVRDVHYTNLHCICVHLTILHRYIL